MEEEWRGVVGYESSYQVSNLGRVRSLNREIVYSDGRVYNYKSMLIKTRVVEMHGYEMVSLNNKKKPKTFTVHRLVALTFVENPNTIDFNIVNHIDGNKLNNRSDNLEWCDKSYNMLHALDTMKLDHCHGEGHHHSKFTKEDVLSIYEKVHNGYSAYKLAEEYGVNHQSIYNIKNGTTWKRVTNHD